LKALFADANGPAYDVPRLSAGLLAVWCHRSVKSTEQRLWRAASLRRQTWFLRIRFQAYLARFRPSRCAVARQTTFKGLIDSNRAMGNLYLVRHGQASFGEADYDNLSDLGRRQSLRLGTYFKLRRMGFDLVIMGRLRRHAQTWAAIAEGAGLSHTPLVWAGLDEYDSEAVVKAIHPEPLEKPATAELYKQHFRLLRDGLKQWMIGATQPIGMPDYPSFVHGVVSALDHVRASNGSNVLIVSSGGPISTAVGQLLGTTAETTIELNFRIRNTSITEFSFNPKRHVLLSFNHLPHLDDPVYAGWHTYA